MLWKLILLLYLSTGICQFTTAQTATAKTDTSKIYKSIEGYSNKSGFTRFVYGLFFKPVVAITSDTLKQSKKKTQYSYRKFEGKIIRNINIVTLDPFGYSVNDTSIAIQNSIYKTGNKMHVKTQHITIQNLLLIHRNEPFDSLLFLESGRLIRSQKYVHEVSFRVTFTGNKKDSIDIFIRESDTWSIVPELTITGSSVEVGITEKNFLGTGHEFENAVAWNHNNGNNAFNTNYIIPNIRNTYISTSFHYGIDKFKNLNKSISVDRPFFSPYAKWAAGVFISQQSKIDSINYNDTGNPSSYIKFNTQDYWAGYAIRIFKGNTENDRSTNLIFAARYYQLGYISRPYEIPDVYHVYSNEEFYLASIGISTRKYIQDSYIFNYGITEDVPVGKVYSITGGIQNRNNGGRSYLGLRYSIGNYNPWGYASFNFEYGTFFNDSHAEQGIFTCGMNYFTDLFEIGKWKFRQFVKPVFAIGINRFPNENITINNENGIRGFSSIQLTGTRKIVCTLQTQSYAPWNFYGFRFGPYLIYSFGMLGNEMSGFKNSGLYSQFGFGLLIKNEYLVFDIFQVSFEFYPIIPGEGSDIFKLNQNSTSDIGFNDFVIGKPAIVSFR